MSSSFVKSCQFILPVTALEFVDINGAQLIYAGIGPRLLLLTEDGSCRSHSDVLIHHSIHGIRCDGALSRVAVFGQKAVAIVTIDHKTFSINCVKPVTELSDWILDVYWPSTGNNVVSHELTCHAHQASHELAVVTAHNSILIWNWSEDKCNEVINSEVNCILYSARCFGSTRHDLCVAVGTVFNEVLVWAASGTSQDNRVMVAVTLKGHEGVIFSVRFSNHGDHICSVSDDRSVRLWQLPDHYSDQTGLEITQASVVLYGHTARVWDAIILPNGIVSVGEDATCRVWRMTGECVGVIEGHKGRGIWSMGINKSNTTVVTGGADGSIRTNHLVALDVNKGVDVATAAPSWEVWLPGTSKQSSPQSQVLVDNSTALVLTTNGCLYQVKFDMSLPSSSCELFEADPMFAVYSIMSLSPSGNNLVMGSLQGCVKLLPLPYNGASCTTTAHKGKVFSLNWTMTNLLVSCGPDGHMCCWRLSDDRNLIKMADMLLPWSKHRWLSAITEEEKSHHLVVGDKKGSIHTYQLLTDDRDHAQDGGQVEPSFTLKGIHGPNGVTHLCYNGGHVYSTGRDGFYRRYTIDQSGKLTELAKYKVFKGFDWIERLLFVDQHQLVVGFHSVDFVIFSITKNKTLYKCHCGGGHRSWDLYCPPNVFSGEVSTFGFIKEKYVHFRHLTLSYNSHVLLEGSHGREITCVTSLGHHNGSTYFATGSEDTAINVMEFDGNSLKCLHTACAHISTVRALSCCTHEVCGDTLLFSGGGRASIKVWKVTSPGTAGPVLSLLTEQYLHEMTEKQKRKLQKKSPLVPTPPECRVMSLTTFPLLFANNLVAPSSTFCIIAGCSDSVIRVYTYCNDRGIVLVDEVKVHHRCVLSVKHFTHPITHPTHLKLASHIVICSAATDGQVILWDVTMLLQSWLDPVVECGVGTDTVCPVVPLCILSCHQSGVNDIDIRPSITGDGVYEVACCGDDGSVAVTRIVITSTSPATSTSLHVQQQEVYREAIAHSSCCTGIRWLGDGCFVTVSTDQRMNIWHLHQRIALQSSCLIHVADVSTLELIRTTAEYCTVIVCGMGIQCSVCTTAVV
ncbi:tRNA (34-2'-O)-methyltransferase regulator WDR6-like isoform X2 [Dysidea avara]|uniref:tRNA (34-2'-O)-methyltransferase regulator WDR6-like isoform X2 n=1 Tax=Dysidea avara TaxID=196820 RepID=UPI00332E954F